jgi:hypothetical protein
MKNPNKTISVFSTGMVVSFTDTQKHTYVPFNRSFQQLQTEPVVKYQKIQAVEFNKLQEHIYCQAVYGFAYFSEDALVKMSKEKKKRIMITYCKVQRALEKLKQETLNSAVDDFLSSLFPKSKFIKQLSTVKKSDPAFRCSFEFKELGITKFKIAIFLVEAGLLPKDFFQLTP